jgi:hypothetical protein
MRVKAPQWPTVAAFSVKLTTHMDFKERRIRRSQGAT